jgi:phosphate transport system permease protein
MLMSAPPGSPPQAQVAAAARPPASKPAYWLGDVVFHLFCFTCAVAVPVTAVLLLLFLCRDSWLSIQRFGLFFFVHDNWDTTKSDFGALPFIWGTIATSALAMLLAVPVSVAAATFLAEIAHGWLRRSATFLTELLAAIPSVVFGFWGIFYIVPILQIVFRTLDIENVTGRGILSASIILAIMIVPYIAAITYDICRAVPASQREGALALGSTRWQMIWHVVLPYARPGIVGACFLALGRALGETMAVAMLIGNDTHLNLNIFGLGSTIPSVIANELGTANQELHKSALIELGLVLFLVTIVVNCLARVLIWRIDRRGKSVGWLARFLHKTPTAKETPAAPRLVRPTEGQRRFAHVMNQVVTVVLAACMVLTLVPLFHIFLYITYRGYEAVDWNFFRHLPIYPNPQEAGLGHSLVGTAIMVVMATVAAVPVGVLAALYLTEYRRSKLSAPVRFVGDLLGGVPSIVVGIFAYALIVQPFGFSAWAGAFALAVLMVPTVMRASEEALKTVPGSLRNASLALGASHSQTVWRVIVPSALPAIVTGVFLAMARIAGETAPLLFTAYNSNYWPWRLTESGFYVPTLSERTPFLTYYIYNYALSEDPDEVRQAWAGAFVLLAFVILLNIGIRFITGRRALQASRAE